MENVKQVEGMKVSVNSERSTGHIQEERQLHLHLLHTSLIRVSEGSQEVFV